MYYFSFLIKFCWCRRIFVDIKEKYFVIEAKESRAELGWAELSSDWISWFQLGIFNMGSSVLFPATSFTGVSWSRVQEKCPRFCVRASLDANVSDMSVNGKFIFFLFYLICLCTKYWSFAFSGFWWHSYVFIAGSSFWFVVFADYKFVREFMENLAVYLEQFWIEFLGELLMDCSYRSR